MTTTIVSDHEKEAMKNLLLLMNAVADDTTTNDLDRKDLAEALVTERTERGARIGAFEIIVKEGKIITYDVAALGAPGPIAKDLYVYEAAHGIVKHLNAGVPINDPRIQDLLTLEENFVKNRNDAAALKPVLRKRREDGDEARAAIVEDRLDEASNAAQDYYTRILKLAGLS